MSAGRGLNVYHSADSGVKPSRICQVSVAPPHIHDSPSPGSDKVQHTMERNGEITSSFTSTVDHIRPRIQPNLRLCGDLAPVEAISPVR